MPAGSPAHSNSLRTAEKHLRKVDPVMKSLIDRYGPCGIGNTNKSMFHHLASAIISQQLSPKAASTIQDRVMHITSRPLAPKSYLAAAESELQTTGLSRAKMSYIRNLAMAMQHDGLSKRKLQGLTDEQVLECLTAIKGIGRWTAEMYLIFGLQRLDILSLGDAGLQRAARKLYGYGEPQPGLLQRVGEKWKPYRSVASWYLWMSLENG